MKGLPNQLTILRIFIIPVFVLAYYIPWEFRPWLTAGLFLTAAVTDALDGYLARKWQQTSAFGAFLDPVADKLVVATALVLLVANPAVQEKVWAVPLLTITVAVIVGREIVVSALREWMAEAGNRATVAVSWIGKFKTAAQMTAITLLLFTDQSGGWLFQIGEALLYVAGFLTLWSMFKYLKAAWPDLMKK